MVTQVYFASQLCQVEMCINSTSLRLMTSFHFIIMMLYMVQILNLVTSDVSTSSCMLLSLFRLFFINCAKSHSPVLHLLGLVNVLIYGEPRNIKLYI